MRYITGRQRGSVTIWGLGLTVIIALFAGIVIDTWRVFAERQDLAGMADAAVIAGATAIDIPRLSAFDEIALDPAEAELRALDLLQRQDGWDPEVITYRIVGAGDGSLVTVVLERDLDFSLLGPLLPGEAPLHIVVTATASPNAVVP